MDLGPDICLGVSFIDVPYNRFIDSVILKKTQSNFVTWVTKVTLNCPNNKYPTDCSIETCALTEKPFHCKLTICSNTEEIKMMFVDVFKAIKFE